MRRRWKNERLLVLASLTSCKHTRRHELCRSPILFLLLAPNLKGNIDNKHTFQSSCNNRLVSSISKYSAPMHFMIRRIHGCQKLSASIRHYATATSRSASHTGTGPSQGAATFQIFDRNLKRTQRDRAADNVEESRKVDYLRDEVASRLAERLLV